MPRPTTAIGFRGMNNLPIAPGKLLDDERRITPRIALNVEVTDGGMLRRRSGYVRKLALTSPHSLWAGSLMLCVSDNILYRIEGVEAIPLATIAGGLTRLNYVEVNNLVYMSNPAWKGVLDLLSLDIRAWGVDVPAAPTFSLVAGDLPPGAYSFCYTRSEGAQLSGNGPVSQISWEGGTQGIRLGNLPSNGQCWITQPNGKKLFLATVVSGVITGQVPQMIPLPSFMVTPPPLMGSLCQAFGRLWGTSEKKIVYSEPHQFEWFRDANCFNFIEEPIMVAPVDEGVFVSSLESTWFLDGTTPSEMAMQRIGDGAIPGTLAFAQMPGAVVGGGYEMSRRQSQLPSPVWMGPAGFVVGTRTGHLVHLTEARLKVNPRNQGASICFNRDGIPRIITSLHGLPAKTDQDEDLGPIFNNGRLFVPAPLEAAASGGFILSN